MLKELVATALVVATSLLPASALAGGTLDMAPDLAWATPMTEAEMAEERGGLRVGGVTIHFDGIVNGFAGEGILHLGGPPPAGLPDPAVENPGAVEIRNFLGSFAGFTGIGQWAIVQGDHNVVNNSMTVNIYVADALGALQAFNDVLAGR
jgi:hypothetical protein